MNRARALLLLVLAALFAVLLGACAPSATPGPAAPAPDPATYRPPEPPATVPGIGEVGRWMITKDLVPATWLGERLGGRTLREPINVLFIDRLARTPEEATARLLTAMTGAGYPARSGHSSGYFGEVGGRLSPMLPKGDGQAFSDAPFVVPNNHGRIFGPVAVDGGFAFTGAFSLEGVRLFPQPGHPYRSFQVAREDLADKLNSRTGFKRAGYVDLGSRLDTPAETTGDHDGRAVLLVAGGP
ncbi:hypothetical protein [Deinococcus apachensis]|uniref:hypothetical protein n=1 Tax=Deinococcus apachensis TaxID=309886 RepID=UPI000377E0D1|nr:hypothetical protein [Deinococcus apachensis]